MCIRDRQIFHLCTVIFIMLLIASCGDDDNDVTGTYELYSYQTTNCDNDEDIRFLEVGDDGCADVNGFDVCLSGVITLNDDNTFILEASIISAIFSTETTGTGEYTSSENIITICDGLDCLVGGVEGNEITVSIPAEDGCILTVKGRK